MKKYHVLFVFVILALCSVLLLAGCSDSKTEEPAEPETEEPAEFDFMPLDEVPESYSAEAAAADGCVVTGEGSFDVSAIKPFAETCAQDAPAMLRTVRYEGTEQTVTDIVFDGSFYKCTTRSSSGTDEHIYPFIIAKDDGIYLCDCVSPSNLDNFTKSAKRAVVTAEDGDITEASDAVKELTRHRLSVDSTVYTSFSPDGKRCVSVKLENSIISKPNDKLEFTVVTPSGVETRGSDDAEEIASKILGLEWLDNERYIMSFNTFYDVNYFELYNTESKEVERHSYCDHYTVENGEVTYID